MSTVEKKRIPYELLFRLEAGKVKGAHVQYLDQLVVDGKVEKETISEAEPVAVVKTDATLKALIGEVVLAQQATLEEAQAKVAEAEAIVANRDLTPELAAKDAIIQQLMEELDALKNPA